MSYTMKPVVKTVKKMIKATNTRLKESQASQRSGLYQLRGFGGSASACAFLSADDRKEPQGLECELDVVLL